VLMAEDCGNPVYTPLADTCVTFPIWVKADVFSMKPANVPFFAAGTAAPASIAVPPVFDVLNLTVYPHVPVLAVPVQAAAGSPEAVVHESNSTLISR